jgi:hypothetical protein
MSGIELSRRFLVEVVAPIVDAEIGAGAYGAALLGDGSEVLGFDDVISTDHGFGPRVQVFVRGDGAALDAALDRALPETFEQWPVRWVDLDRLDGALGHQVDVTTVSAFFSAALGFDPLLGAGVHDWLASPTQRLATLTAGPVFADGTGELAAARAAVAWYPDDVWRYALAAQWRRIAQLEAFVGRTGARGDELGSAIVGDTLVRDHLRLAFLVERRWAPYPKWLGRAFGTLACASALGPMLERAAHAGEWRARSAALCDASEFLMAATNDLALAKPVEPTRRQFWSRDIQVIDADRAVTALCDAITEPEVTAYVDASGRRESVPQLLGTIDQFVDSTDVLAHPDRCRQLAATIPH